MYVLNSLCANRQTLYMMPHGSMTFWFDIKVLFVVVDIVMRVIFMKLIISFISDCSNAFIFFSQCQNVGRSRVFHFTVDFNMLFALSVYIHMYTVSFAI